MAKMQRVLCIEFKNLVHIFVLANNIMTINTTLNITLY